LPQILQLRFPNAMIGGQRICDAQTCFRGSVGRFRCHDHAAALMGAAGAVRIIRLVACPHL